MSSIAASDRSSQTDEIRRIRDEYEQKEAEEAKKKNKELRSMNEKQEQELTKIKDQYDSQLEAMRSKNGEAVEEKDKRHNEDIAKMRELYVDSLRKKSIDESREREAFKSSYENDLKKEKEISAQQKEVNERGFRSSLEERDRVYTDHSQRAEVSLQKGLEERTDHLNKKHEEEMKSIVEDRDRRVGELHHTADEMKSIYADRLATEERKNRADTDRRTTAFDTIYRNQEHTNAELIANRDAVLAEARHQMGEKMGERIQNNDQKMENLRKQYAEQMDSRTGNMVREARAEVSRAKNDSALEAITNRRLRDLDHKHLVGAYQAREDDLLRQRDEVFEKVNDVAHKRIDMVVDRDNKIMNENNRKNRMEQNIQAMRDSEALSQQEVASKDQIQHTNNRADQRIRGVMRATTVAQQNQIKQHEDSLDNLKHSYQDKVQNQREAQLESMKNIYARMDQKLRDLETHFMQKHDDTVEYYETKLEALDADRKKEAQRMAQNFEARSNQREKGIKMEEDTLTQKYEQKMATQDDVHQKEMNRMEKRHQEQLQAVAQRAAAAAQNKKTLG